MEQETQNRLKTIREEIQKAFIGKEEVIEKIMICFLAEGHVLLEDVPGVGKTTLAKAFAHAMGLQFGRIQFTPDTLPSDVTGVSIYNMKTGEFEYQQGAVMCQVLLADEINRTSPKTQASLLEAMGEGQVTVDGVTFSLPDPFFVIATQNPVEYLGTYPLPEAQLDRFMMRLSIGYPTETQEIQMIQRKLQGEFTGNLEKTDPEGTIRQIREQVKEVLIQESVLSYMEEIISSTRKESRFVLGASPRAFLMLAKAARAKAFLAGRDYVLPDDVKELAPLVLSHRLLLTSQARIAGEEVSGILKSLVLKCKVPV